MRTQSMIHDAEIVAASLRRRPHAPLPRLPKLANRIASELEFGHLLHAADGIDSSTVSTLRAGGSFISAWIRGIDDSITMRQAVQNAIDGVLFSTLTRGVP